MTAEGRTDEGGSEVTDICGVWFMCPEGDPTEFSRSLPWCQTHEFGTDSCTLTVSLDAAEEGRDDGKLSCTQDECRETMLRDCDLAHAAYYY